ncbi:MAG: 6,7-dimethyl-8-ribityllumazine synthase [Actinomycetota bacterium]|nr:MAG: 6,7-dimethyl-8-ribityllumazine synthase [Actinomycetota bacterium]
MTEFVGTTHGQGRRVAIVAARFNGRIVARLVEGARRGLEHHGVAPDAIDLAWVPGAFEIPLVAERLARTGDYDAVICLGAVIRGETLHFELVARATSEGVAAVSRATGVPCIFEVLATEDLAQAEARAGGVHGNKGWEAAEAALRMASLLASLPQGGAR